MIVVESGGTKSTWTFNNKLGETQSLETVGLHPQELTKSKIEVVNRLVREQSFSKEEIYFYGAGCESTVARDKIKNFFIGFGFSIQEINTDIYAACIANLGNQPGIVGILGTGAVAAQFDGEKVERITSGWGYMLGDEGSGFDIGKRLLQAHLGGNLPHKIQKEIIKYFDGQPILHRIYAEDGRQFVAGLSILAYRFKEEKQIQNILKKSFTAFCTTALSPLKKEGVVHFVGSIAYYFQKELAKTLREECYELGKIQKNAGKGMYDFLSKNG